MALGAGTALGAALVLAPAAQAANFEVTITDDENDGGSTPCTDDLGDCALREAVIEANDNGADDTITFASNVTGTIELEGTNNPIFVRDTVSIDGPGASVLAVSGQDDTQIFYSYSFDDEDPLWAISGLTLRDGNSPGTGGAIRSVTGSSASIDLTITDSVLTANEADNRGGAIYSEEGTVTITGSGVSDNESGDEGGAIYVYGGDFLMESSSVIRNAASNDGGGINSELAPVTIRNSTIADNTSEQFGGGLFPFRPVGPSLVESTTISGNEAADNGGGVYTDYAGELTFRNVTVSGNTADESGGGISFCNCDPEDAPAILNSTIVDNTATESGGGVYLDALDLTVSSTIIANNAADSNPDIAGDSAEFDIDFSLIGDTGDVDVNETTAGSNLLGADPQLGGLASNGGPTQTHAPSLTSPVLDRGIANSLATDQRGLARISDSALIANGAGSDGSDIGAVEVQFSEANCQGAIVTRTDGGEGDDNLAGTDAAEALNGLGGNDSLNAAGGNDCVSGGAGKDRANGAGGKDKVRGDAGRDNVKGGGGKDKLSGGGGKDKLTGGGGKDRLKGGPGKDKLVGGGGKDRFNCGGGQDKVTAQPKDKVSASCETVVEKG